MEIDLKEYARERLVARGGHAKLYGRRGLNRF
jgi:hypothetical protein